MLCNQTWIQAQICHSAGQGKWLYLSEPPFPSYSSSFYIALP